MQWIPHFYVIQSLLLCCLLLLLLLLFFSVANSNRFCAASSDQPEGPPFVLHLRLLFTLVDRQRSTTFARLLQSHYTSSSRSIHTVLLPKHPAFTTKDHLADAISFVLWSLTFSFSPVIAHQGFKRRSVKLQVLGCIAAVRLLWDCDRWWVGYAVAREAPEMSRRTSMKILKFRFVQRKVSLACWTKIGLLLPLSFPS